MSMAAILINKLWRFVQILIPFNRRVNTKFKEKQPRGFWGEVVQSRDRQRTDGRMDGRRMASDHNSSSARLYKGG